MNVCGALGIGCFRGGATSRALGPRSTSGRSGACGTGIGREAVAVFAGQAWPPAPRSLLWPAPGCIGRPVWCALRRRRRSTTEGAAGLAPGASLGRRTAALEGLWRRRREGGSLSTPRPTVVATAVECCRLLGRAVLERALARRCDVTGTLATGLRRRATALDGLCLARRRVPVRPCCGTARLLLPCRPRSPLTTPARVLGEAIGLALAGRRRLALASCTG